MTQPNARTTPFVDETITLAENCFSRFYAMNQRDLTANTPHADQEALNLIRTGFPAAVKAAQRSGREMLAFHFEILLAEVPRDNAYRWLRQLASRGGDPNTDPMQPIGSIVTRILQRQRPPQ